MMTDPIADMLTRIRNASMAHKKEVIVAYSKIKLAIASILVREGYLLSMEEDKKDSHAYLVIKLKYDGGDSVIHSLKRVSKPGHRIYVKKENIGRVLSGFGVAILSTPRGVLSDHEAKKAQVGGELLCEVY